MKRNIWHAFKILSALALIVTNFFLLHTNRELSRRLQSIETTFAPEVGSKFSVISGNDLKGNLISKDYGVQKSTTLFLVFSPSCKYCELNWPYWLRIVRQPAPLNVVYADATGQVTEQFFNKLDLAPASQDIVKLNPAVVLEYRLLSTPTTVVVGPGGKVMYAHIGILNEIEVNRIEKLLSTQPPLG